MLLLTIFELVFIQYLCTSDQNSSQCGRSGRLEHLNDSALVQTTSSNHIDAAQIEPETQSRH
jgi:hypothetical protein